MGTDKFRINSIDISRSNSELLSYTGVTDGEGKTVLEIPFGKYNVFEISVVHFVGEFYTGDPLFLVVILGGHRGETYQALNEVVERVKHEVDFKKEEISNQGTKTIMAGG